MDRARVTLKPEREKSLLKNNPWIFSGAVESVDEFEYPGQVADILSHEGKFLAAGFVNPESKIFCRVLTRTPESIDHDFITGKLAAALRFRREIVGTDTNAYRVVNAEGDFLPGLIIDRYGDGIVMQILSAGMECLRDQILTAVEEQLKPSFIVERSDTAGRAEEGLKPASGILKGTIDAPIEIIEKGLKFRVDVLHGQKTGFYLDQRDSRFLIRAFSPGRTVLNLFSYTGGFTINAASSGASRVTSVDSSESALNLAREHIALNNLDEFPADFIKYDVFDYLNAEKNPWDLIICDPPAFAGKKSSVEKAARGYKDLNMRALKLLSPGGILATFSCSHHISPTLFRQIIYAAVVDSGRQAQVIVQTGHPVDHPFNICHKEGEYLKGLYLRVF